ncbi:MAG TPA: SRPBCC domain-containing protein [Rubrobacter sp.]|nr:SRPBCC domain-containing protein [Rubrobacter sp.]
MRELHSEIEITASAGRTWLILTDFASYPRWNPFIRRISGEPTTGEHLDVRLEPPNSRGMTFKPKVLNAEPDRELRWLGHLLVPGLFDGEHVFTIQLLEDNRVRFIQREAFKGLLVPLSARNLDTNTQRGFEETNRALKERAEAPLSRPPGDAGPGKEER